MKKLLILSIVTITLTSVAGCNRGWPRWLCRGDDCNSCDGMGGPSLLSPSYGPSYGPVYGPTIGTGTTELPGPVTAIPQG